MSAKPNIVFILSDDQGAWALHCAGNTDIRTPNLDALAENGIRFDNFFCASPVCSPARASILTGTIPSVHGVQDWIRSGNVDRSRPDAQENQFRDETKEIRYLENMTAYTDLLARNGYTCALSGKWHLGDSVHPQHGFTHWYTIARGGCTDYYAPEIVSDGKIKIEDKYITDLITDDAIQCIHTLSEQENPFYLSVHYTAPHDPWGKENHPSEFWDLYNDCDFTATPDLPIHPNQIMTAPCGTGQKRKDLLHGYYAAISAMDAGIGRIVNTLKEKNLLDNTIFFFTADNGMNMGQHGIWGKGNGTFPMNMYDSSVKVPMIISGIGAKGVVNYGLFSHYDIMPTLIDYLHLSGEPKQVMIGKSFAGILRGSSAAEDGCVVVFDEYGPVRMIRNARYKYILNYPYGPAEFYDLETDPDESQNLIDSAQYKPTIIQMKRDMECWFCKYADPRIDAIHQPVTGAGQLCKSGIFAEGKPVFAQRPKFVNREKEDAK